MVKKSEKIESIKWFSLSACRGKGCTQEGLIMGRDAKKGYGMMQ